MLKFTVRNMSQAIGGIVDMSEPGLNGREFPVKIFMITDG